jgi:hypothetical protein
MSVTRCQKCKTKQYNNDKKGWRSGNLQAPKQVPLLYTERYAKLGEKREGTHTIIGVRFLRCV